MCISSGKRVLRAIDQKLFGHIALLRSASSDGAWAINISLLRSEEPGHAKNWKVRLMITLNTRLTIAR
jgi:hypothetical protein